MPQTSGALDSHVHLWDATIAASPWLEGDRNARLRREFTLSDLQIASSTTGTSNAIAVTADESLGETFRLLDIAESDSFLAGVIGWIDLRGASFDEDLERLESRSSFRGIRESVISRGPGWLDQPNVFAALRRLSRAGHVLELLVSSDQLDAVIRLAWALPELQIVVDHLGNPPGGANARLRWARQVEVAADHSNVALKLSGLEILVDESPARVKDPSVVDRAVEAFGTSRILVGSDWPVSTLWAPYGDVADAYRRELARFSPQEQDDMLGGVARRFYGIVA
jgi:L-fuconolactonase